MDCESHNRLILIDLVKGTNKHLLHPKINQGSSLGLEQTNDSLYWAHTDSSIKINLKTHNMDFYSPPIVEEVNEAAQIASDIFFIKNKLVFKASQKKTPSLYSTRLKT